MTDARSTPPRRPAVPARAPEVLRRGLATAAADGAPGVTGLLDAVACTDGRVRVMTRHGTPAEVFAGGPETEEIRTVAGAVMIVIPGTADPAALALADGTRLTVTATPAETAFLAGREVLLSFRLDEDPRQVAEGLAYHALHHGATGAVVVNRTAALAGDGAAFARVLQDELAGLDLRVVVVEPTVPLGRVGMPAENHPMLAPDAPGKDRMEPPPHDLWRAPLAESLIFEALKWRFLAEARAVLTLDVSDILAPRAAGAPSAFDLCAAAANGVILLTGRRIYPWRVRAGALAGFGDHICRPFDARRGIARWGVAPQKAGLQNTWRMLRVAYARPDAGGVVPFFRAMAIRVPGRTSAELAPKTSLIEDAGLLALAERVFAHKPVRPPLSRPRPGAPEAVAAGRTAIVTTMKNEAPFILEWVAYHRAIGVDDFLVYTNDCTDGTDTMLSMLQQKGIVQHRENPWRPGSILKPQHAALQAAEDEPVMQHCGWGICMDVDEFINVRIGDGTLGALYAAMGQANMISLTWRLFGNSDIHAYDDRFLIAQFTRCAPEIVRKPHQAWGFKTLFRNIEIYKKLGVHRPKGLRPDLWDQVRWLNGSGKPMPKEMFRNGWRSTLETYGYDWVSLNHYAVRSAESFLVKRDRGRVNHVDRDQGLNYWFRMNHNAAEDRSIQRMIPRLQAEWDRLMADPDIAAAHTAAVAAHRAKIADLRAAPANAAFYDELTGPRMERLCRMQQHFGSAVFMHGPGVIPPDLHTRDVPADFFFTVERPAEAEH